MHNPRTLILRALLLDGAGQLLILGLILWVPTWLGFAIGGSSLAGQWGWLLFSLLLYPLLGWLFGSFTILRWPRLSPLVLLRRLLLVALATLITVAVARWLINPEDQIWLVYRRIQLLWMAGLTAWVFGVRVVLRKGLLMPIPPRLLLLADEEGDQMVRRAWQRVPQREPLVRVDPDRLPHLLDQSPTPVVVAVTAGFRQQLDCQPLLNTLERYDPRAVRVLSIVQLFEQQQERLPPVLMDDALMVGYDDLPWAAPFSVQAQLKRIADLLLSMLLLLLTAPVMGLAMLLIWLEDHGPVFYVQERSGWLGRPFQVLKLRTMRVQPADTPAQWTQKGDQRITDVGRWLRRVRLDELPQLLNVIKGEMSLIGPRPERPALEHQLEERIPHYRKRHWMRPGLSGWAQVCAPYASSIEDSDLKLSYDLYYLKRFNTWIDLVILFRTIKTILKAGGR